MDHEEIPSVPSTPATPGTPGAPLFGGFRSEKTGNGIGKMSLLKNCKCFSVEEWTLEDGALPKVSCSLPPPPVPLARKVLYIYILIKENIYRYTNIDINIPIIYRKYCTMFSTFHYKLD